MNKQDIISAVTNHNEKLNEAMSRFYGAGGGGCFPAGTKIKTPDGYINIEDIKTGQRVLAFDKDGNVSDRIVRRKFTHSYGEVGYTSPLLVIIHQHGQLIVTGNHYIRTPSVHSIETEEGFARADDLRLGDILYTADGAESIILSISNGYVYDYVYNLEVDEFHTYIAEDIRVHNGGGGKGGGGGSGAVEAPDTLRNNSYVFVLELLSEGQINGLHTDDGRSVLINGTPLQNSNGSFNFNGAGFIIRNGTLDQPYIPGFDSVNAIVPIGVAVTAATPYTYTVSSANVDAVRVTIEFPNGLKSQDMSSGNINGSSAGIQIKVKDSLDGTWTTYWETTKSGKSNSAYDFQVYVHKPQGTTGTWDIQIVRTSADATTSNIINNFTVTNIVEINEVKLAYPGYAYIGVMLDARQFGSSIPIRSFLIDGVNIQVPSNYNLTTHTFAGLWDGTFVSGFSDDPAWVLYDLLTNTTYGCGRYGITASQIDKFSFYNASVFNNALVPDGHGGTERRFTFNAALSQRTDMLTVLMNVAGMMNAQIAYVNGLITLIQDRPTEASFVVNKSNVIDGMFTYKSTPLNNRTTVTNVSWSNKNNKYLPTVTNVTGDSAAASWLGFDAVARYGFNPVNIAAFGATTEGQGIRAARWYLYTNLIQKEIVEFSMGLNGHQLNVGDVVSIFDEDYTNQIGAGRVTSATSSTITFDRSVVVSGATPTVSVVLPDGVTYETHAITDAAGTYSTVNIAAAGTTINQQTGATGNVAAGWSTIPTQYCPYNVTSAIQPRTFRIIDIKQNTGNPSQVDITAILYDKNNYLAIEQGISIPAGTYTLPVLDKISQPNNLDVTSVSTIINGLVKHNLVVTWDKPTDGVADHYILKYRVGDNNYVSIPGIQFGEYEIVDAQDGLYEITVNAIGYNQVASPPSTVYYTLDTTGAEVSMLNPVTGLTLTNGTATSDVPDFNIQWINPTTNTADVIMLKEFVVQISNGSTTVRTEIVPPVAPGAIATFTYTNEMNKSDNSGVPARSITVYVYCKDSKNNFSSVTTNTFTNPPPSVPSVLSVTPSTENITFDLSDPSEPSDFAGTIVWMSTVSGFTPSNANKAIVSPSKHFNLSANRGTVYYYRVAWYDTFSTENLNIGSEQSVTTNITTADMPDVPANLTLTSTAVRNSGDGTVSASITAQWDALTANVSSYTLNFRDVTGVGQISSVTTTNNSYTWNGLKNANQYGIAVRGDNQILHSAFSAEQFITTASSNVAPGNCSSLTTTSSFKNIWLDWVNPSDKDLAGIEVWASDTNDRANASLISNTLTDTYTHSGLATGTTKYYWVRAKNTSGLTSDYYPLLANAGVSGTTANIQTVDYANLSIGTAQIMNAAIDEAKIANLAVTSAKIQTATIETLNLKNGAVTDPLFYLDSTNYSIVLPARSGSGSMTNFMSGNLNGIYFTTPTIAGLNRINFYVQWTITAEMNVFANEKRSVPILVRPNLSFTSPESGNSFSGTNFNTISQGVNYYIQGQIGGNYISSNGNNTKVYIPIVCILQGYLPAGTTAHTWLSYHLDDSWNSTCSSSVLTLNNPNCFKLSVLK